MVSDALPVLFSVTAWPALVDPTVVLAKVREAGESVAVVIGATPVPVSVTVCGLLESLSVMVTAAELVPAIAGLKVTLIAQLAPAANELPQVFVSAKSPLSAPVTAMLVIDKAEVALFVSVVDCALLVTPTV